MARSTSKGKQLAKDGDEPQRHSDRTLRSFTKVTSKEQKSYNLRHHEEPKGYERPHNSVQRVGRRRTSKAERAERETDLEAVFDDRNGSVSAASSIEEIERSEDVTPDGGHYPGSSRPESSPRKRKRVERNTSATTLTSEKPEATSLRRSARRANTEQLTSRDAPSVSPEKPTPVQLNTRRPTRPRTIPKSDDRKSKKVSPPIDDICHEQEGHGFNGESFPARLGPSQPHTPPTPKPLHATYYAPTQYPSFLSTPAPTPQHHPRRGHIVWSQTFVNVTPNDLQRKVAAATGGDIGKDLESFQYDPPPLSSRSLQQVVWPEDRRHNTSSSLPPPPLLTPPSSDETRSLRASYNVHNVTNTNRQSLVAKSESSSFTFVPYVPTVHVEKQRNPIDDNAAAETLLALSGKPTRL